MNIFKGRRKALAFTAATALCMSTLFTGTASAVMTTVSVSPSDPRTSQTAVTYTYTASGYQTATAVKCVKVQYTTTPTGSTFPTGMAVSGTTFAGTLLSGQTFTADDTSAATGVVVYNNSTGVTPAGSAKTLTIAGITNPSSAATIYVRVTTYDTQGSGSSGACAGSVLDTETVVGAAITDGTTVSVTVDPSFSFTVADNNGACNGETNTAGAVTNGTSVALGNMAVSASRGDAQLLTVSGNAGGGYSVFVRATQNTPLRSAGHNWADGGAAWGGAGSALTGAGTEEFGVFPHDNDNTGSVVTATPASGTGYTLTNATTNEVMDSTASAGTGCLGFVANTGTATPAGSYTATIIYTAVPTY